MKVHFRRAARRRPGDYSPLADDFIFKRAIFNLMNIDHEMTELKKRAH